MEQEPEYTPYSYDEVPGNRTWAHTLPKPGLSTLYNQEYEKDACGVGFACHIKGVPSHKIVSDSSYLLCNMAHRGAVGSDARDGDGAGVMTSIPHKFMEREFQYHCGVKIPRLGEYAVGNVFFKNDDQEVINRSKATFTNIAKSLGLRVLGWRNVPHDSSILGPASLSREPFIQQPCIVLEEAYGEGDSPAEYSEAEFEEKFQTRFEKQLFILRKQSTHTIGIHNWYYICSLSNKNIVYKGQLTPAQVFNYYHDLVNVEYESHFALVHSRFSTNTFPSWDRAQPLRWAAHNGEINTLRGNKNWMRAREGVMSSTTFEDDELDKLYPIIEEGGSDSGAFDNVLELLMINGVLSLPEAVMLLIPEAWQNNANMPPKMRAFYEWAACLMEPWDGPALFTFADGRYCGANLDRNGLRPCRFYVTDDDLMICGSEVGVIPNIDPAKIIQKGRLRPGRMLLVDTKEGRIVDDRELKSKVASRFDFKSWVLANQISIPELISKLEVRDISLAQDLPEDAGNIDTDPRLKAFGYSLEQINLIIGPMGASGKEALGSMGNDTALACISEKPKLTYEYFRQLFAQVTNPPIDPIRESIVMSLECPVGPQGNILEMKPQQCNRLLLKSPILTNRQFKALTEISNVYPQWKISTIDITFDKEEGLLGYTNAISRICQQALLAISENSSIIILSDRNISQGNRIPLSALVSVGAVHHHLVRQKQRSKVAIIVETGEAREVHHMCTLVGYGCDGINPYLAMETLLNMNKRKLLRSPKGELTDDQVINNYKSSINSGILKVMSKMGISTLASYKGAQIFEILGMDNSIVDRCFAGTASRIKGVTFEYLAQDAFTLHDQGFTPEKFNPESVRKEGLPETGEYHWRDGGEAHINDPAAIASIQDAVRNKNEKAYEAYSKKEYEAIKNCTLRGLLDFDFDHSTPVPIDQVEPWTEIVRRFATGAMSYGSISMESHSTLAVAMNRLGGKSNTGEGGEDKERSHITENGDTMRSAIKQIASGRFGVTAHYLADADELQIKMAQGAKPGEGGELPGHKVSKEIARTRHSTPGVGLISPPPHHDIYSIEDLKQLIYDLKCSNPRARISVKLVSEVGVGIIAAGVAKAKAEHILISGHDGGTGASRWTGIKYAGLPWELGLAETHQTLVLNDLRGRVVVQTDGQLKTGRDIAIACLLGAEEWGFATAPLIAMGCIMMRKCHLNTCPVGIATQDPELRSKFEGTPEHVINFFYYLANELRQIMAKLGFRTINEMVGRAEKLFVREEFMNTKNVNIDLSPILTPAHSIRPGVATRCVRKQDYKLHMRLDNKLIDEAEVTLENGLPVTIVCDITNTDRAFGSTLSYRISKKFGEEGLPHDTVHVNVTGNAGQSFGAYLAPGVTLELEGDCNDYVGKGLSGGRIIVYPPKSSVFKAEENMIVGNTCLYGATSGAVFISGIAAERFAVRNSGATAVVEGAGDHCCEYMTGGRVVVLGSTGINFAAGMSGGIAYVLDMAQEFEDTKVNKEMVELSSLTDPSEIAFLRGLIEDHRHYTGSGLANNILQDFNRILPRFVKVLPYEYKNVLEKEKKELEKVKQDKVQNFFEKLKQDPEADVTNGEILRNKKSSCKKAEPKITDLEDAILNVKSEEKKLVKLDKLKGFMKYKRLNEPYRSAKTRTKDWNELSTRLTKDELKQQTARCMDCGVPFCTSDTGCPISNIIPQWNELVFRDQWYEALQRLLMTNNFPEFTSKVCPAPCEGACVVNLTGAEAVGIKSVEAGIIDYGFKQGWIKPQPPKIRTGKTIAIIGSGPAGLAAADQLNKAGHSATIYERADRPGGLLMYGIPNMKLDKGIVKRRTDLMAAEGVEFKCNVNVGEDITLEELERDYDAVVVAIGSTIPRDLKIPGRELNNIKFAMELLKWNTQALLDDYLDNVRDELEGKHVVVIGGGDTGNDCLGTATRHGAKSVTNFELLPHPPETRSRENPWPQWPRVFRVDYGHSEVATHYGKDPRQYSILSKSFEGDDEGNVKGINTVRVEWKQSDSGAWQMAEVPGSEDFFPADVVLLSMGFMGPELDKSGLGSAQGLHRDKRGNISTISTSGYRVSNKVFVAGDCRRGQSLIVWGIQEGRQCAREVDNILNKGESILPGNGSIELRNFKKLEELAAKA
ncbi:Glutamate synthase NADH dependent [Komagataella phaffii CBS 7435]|uniref:Glutamate synthase [NADH] n=2 Tax=Komagataella phaffii TaxID=460519 RepID=C4R6A0_KOMPG|nr:NAD(+)-dependent glutamate synthase (GOGAT) [Komagataella phaffii GS115]AOA64131.1 GQ67_04154T0 [Komagataella phaffii]CAH2449075.1 Glutamate synthase NADH dependent [Komagataella phaffii CBS 7435]AOA68212.1 GQ68_04127T0 [Komagataella phaffii GS115]CAY71086.1 NAD(+)-dependent glutamate synthase (GOGAT) [Komagataella phaffii GS115]SCV12164.1 Glutamate synthase NADH dependent [Komagataella phaffii CBS 7435]